MGRCQTYKVITVAFVLVAITGCAVLGPAGETVFLSNGSGQTVQCGPYNVGIRTLAVLRMERLRACVEDYQRQGYERVPAP